MMKRTLIAIIAACPAMTARAAESIDLAGEWSCQLAGKEVPGDLATAEFPAAKAVRLPGTLDEAGLGEDKLDGELLGLLMIRDQ